MSRGTCWHPGAEPRDKGVEPAVQAALVTIARALDAPGLHACETGAFPGTATVALRLGLEYGTLRSYESRHEFAVAHGAREGTPDTFEPYGLTFLDSSPYSLRDEEFALWWQTARRGAFLLVHDVFDERWRKPWPLFGPPPMSRVAGPWGLGVWRKLYQRPPYGAHGS